MENKKYAEVYHTIGGKDITMIDKKATKDLQRKLDIALVALKSVARNDVNWSHAIVEKALKEIEES